MCGKSLVFSKLRFDTRRLTSFVFFEPKLLVRPYPNAISSGRSHARFELLHSGANAEYHHKIRYGAQFGIESM